MRGSEAGICVYMFTFFGKIVAIIETLIEALIPFVSPTPIPTPFVEATPTPIVEVVESSTPIPILTPTPTPKIEDVIVQLQELKNELLAYTPEPTPEPQIIYIVQTPTPTLIPIPLTTPIPTPIPTPDPVPTPIYLPIPTTSQKFISQLPESLVKHINWCYQNYPSITLYSTYQISNKWPSIDSPEGRKVINYGEEYGKTPNSGCGMEYLSPGIKSADIQSLYGPINLTDYQRTFQESILNYLRTNFIK